MSSLDSISFEVSASQHSESKIRRLASPSDEHGELDNVTSNTSASGIVHQCKIPKSDDVYYKTNNAKSGYAILFVHEMYDINDVEPRKTPDIQNAKNCFESLGFETIPFIDCTKDEIWKAASDVSQYDHQDKDCLIVVISTHGQQYGQLLAKDTSYSINDLITKFAMIESLIGKPKIFIVQACRGSTFDHGVATVDSVCSNVIEEEEEILTIPVLADCLIIFASFQGFYAAKSEKGSYLLNNIFLELKQNAFTKDMLSIFRNVTRHTVNEKFSINREPAPKTRIENMKQNPTINCLLTRKLKLTEKSVSKHQDRVPYQNMLPKNYEMNHKFRGFALIFDYDNFDDTIKEKYINEMPISSPDSNIDIMTLNDTLEDYGFDTKLHKNLGKTDFLDTLRKYAKLEKSDSDCMMIIINTFGSQTHLVLKDELLQSSDVFEIFFGNNCPSLIGKPKLFIINLMNGIKNGQLIVVEPEKNLEMGSPSTSDPSKIFPVTADILIMYSTSVDAIFKNNHTFFLKVFQEELKNSKSDKMEIFDILQKVSTRILWDYKVQLNNKNSEEAQIMPRIISTLLKELIFEQ